jgi:hypothetical protein
MTSAFGSGWYCGALFHRHHNGKAGTLVSERISLAEIREPSGHPDTVAVDLFAPDGARIPLAKRLREIVGDRLDIPTADARAAKPATIETPRSRTSTTSSLPTSVRRSFFGAPHRLRSSRRMAAFGASRPLPYVPAKVSFLITQRAFSGHSGNWSSCPTPVIHGGRLRRDRAGVASERGYCGRSMPSSRPRL